LHLLHRGAADFAGDVVVALGEWIRS
jgi:hypothetical protein